MLHHLAEPLPIVEKVRIRKRDEVQVLRVFLLRAKRRSCKRLSSALDRVRIRRIRCQMVEDCRIKVLPLRLFLARGLLFPHSFHLSPLAICLIRERQALSLPHLPCNRDAGRGRRKQIGS